MKKTFLTALSLMTILAPTLAISATKTITIDWGMSDTTNVTGYKMYYSNNSDMAGKTLACETSDPSAVTLTCPNVNIESYPIYFTIVAIKTDGEVESEVEPITYTISSVQDFAVTTPGATPPPIAQDGYAINFQPASASVPSGFLSDNGNTFSIEKGYGWTELPADTSQIGARDRDDLISPDQSFDTLIWISEQALPQTKWELMLPNGAYQITLCMGDPTYGDDLQNAQIEGAPIITSESLSSETRWITRTINSNITDGRLTLTFTGSSSYARPTWIKVLPQ